MKILDVPQSGSVGGVVSSRNRSGQYRRTRAIPTQPRTTAQLNQRSRLSTQSAAWRGLSAANISSWNAFALSFTVRNSLGSSINLTGHQAFIKVNTVLLLNGEAVVTAPPPLPTFVANTITGITATASTHTVSIAGTAPATGTDMMIYVSGQKSPGVSFNSNWAYLTTYNHTVTLPLNVGTAYEALKGTLVSGKKIFFKAVQAQSGMQDNGTQFTAIVA